jgi:hypothetical protein
MLCKEFQNVLAFFVVQFDNLLSEDPVDEKTLPTRNRIGSKNGVNRLEIESVVQGGATVGSQRFVLRFGGGKEKAALMFGSQTFQELSVRRRETIYEFVARGP